PADRTKVRVRSRRTCRNSHSTGHTNAASRTVRTDASKGSCPQRIASEQTPSFETDSPSDHPKRRIAQRRTPHQAARIARIKTVNRNPAVIKTHDLKTIKDESRANPRESLPAN